MDKVVVIAGVTASGKSRLAVRLAQRFNGEIISADAYQAYKGMDIGTNKITSQKTEGVPHHLLDCVTVDEVWDVSVFQKMAREKIGDIVSRGKLPIVCGGTGFYVQALIKDYRFLPLPKKGEYSAFSAEQLRAMLLRVDADELVKITGNNRRRLQKALDFFATHGIKKSEHDTTNRDFFYDALIIFLDPPKEQIVALVNQRTQGMLDRGWAKEVDILLKAYPDFADSVAAKAIGYQQIIAGEYDAGKIAKQVMEYSRKQRTWFVNKDQDRTLVLKEIFGPSALEDAIKAVEHFLGSDSEEKNAA